MQDDVTPIRQQYLEIKRYYPNAILFFRLGDFYETFDQDAETASRELDIVLTSRNVAKGSRVPMAGIPYHAYENYVARLRPAEILHPEPQNLMDETIGGHPAPWPAWRFEPGKCEEVLLSHFRAASLEGFGLKGQGLSIRAAGVIVQYLKETQPDALTLLTSLRVYSLSEFMTLDAATRRNLELTETLRGEVKGALLSVLDHTVTPMGKRLMRAWVSQPLLDVNKIKSRQ